MKSMLAVSKSVSVAFQNWVVSLERHHWKNEQHSQWECIEIVGILDTTNENEACELIEMATGTPDSLEACHHLQDVEIFFSKKNKAKGFNLRSINIETGTAFNSESPCSY